MNHIAIMEKSLGLIEKILSGEKQVESRWYVNRINPWDKIEKGDIVYFKYSGKPVIARAKVTKVLQISELNKEKFNEIVIKYAKQICLQTKKYTQYYKPKRCCILIFLEEPNC